MEEKIFVPRYSIGFWAMIAVTYLWSLLAIFGFFQSNDQLMWGAFSLLFISFLLFPISKMIKRIIFQEKITVKYFFLKAQEIEYGEIDDMNNQIIQAGKYTIDFASFANRDQFLQIIEAYKTSGKITKAQLSGKLKRDADLSRRSAGLAALGSLFATIVTPIVLIAWFPHVKFDVATTLIIFFVTIYMIVFATLRWIDARERKHD